MCESKSVGLRAIAADNDERADIALAEISYGPQLRLLGFEFWISLAAQDRSSVLDNSANVPKTQRKEVIAERLSDGTTKQES